jgi:hypothetical protein
MDAAKFWGIVGPVCFVLSAALWLAWYWPSIEIKATSEAADPAVGMPVSFSVEETSVLAAQDPTYQCYFANVFDAQHRDQFHRNSMGKIPLRTALLLSLRQAPHERAHAESWLVNDLCRPR